MTTQPSTRGAGAAMFALPGVSDGVDRGRVVDQMVARASSLGFDAWWRRAENTYASLARSAGADMKLLQVTMGHASIMVTAHTYADLYDSDLDRVADALDGLGGCGDCG